MSRKWMRIVIAPFLIVSLAACSSSAEEQTKEGLKAAKEIFHGDIVESNEQIDHVELFVPSGFTIQENSDETNIVLMNNSDSYVLFINPNEKQNSNLFYDLLQAEKKETIIVQQTFEQNGRFGFVAVYPSGEDKYEIISSIGGVKLTTISDEANIATNMEKMMKMVRSVKVEA
ncbi:hypothetical protein [Paenisporosarcina indica]|uniref:hypothetical protein n=1 Tax=Paenisporosarcina indica TaxID=650093 RepID=UPI00094F54B9|nr:hypothetical protein [Paenisporosarcina indica]